MANPVLFHKFVAVNEAPLYKKPRQQGDGQRAINKLLLGTWIGITKEEPDHYYVRTAGPDGWISKAHTSDDMGLKVFFIDVGQGDGVLIEVGDKRILLDSGPDDNIKNYLTKWQYSYMVSQNQTIHIDYVFISHFDSDHYAGLIDIFNDTRFSFGTVFHNGIARFHNKKNSRPGEYNTDLGTTETIQKKKYLTTTFNTLDDLNALREAGGFSEEFNNFALSVKTAHEQGRLQEIRRLTYEYGDIDLAVNGKNCKFQVLGPISSNGPNGAVHYLWLGDSSHTRNGHSIVLKLIYENISLLLGGDLNRRSEQDLLKHYKPNNPFEVDVAKSCHHGSSDFEIDFMRALRPYATIISSGDNEAYAHPRADAVGAAGKYSKGELPKVFSTELARSVKSSGKILFGMINFRSDGKQIYMSQMKESGGGGDIWDSYSIIG